MSEPNIPPKPPAPTEEHEFSSRNVRSNIAPIFHILQSEQLILQRTDQKAFTLMSILGVFMVFFIVHFPKIEITYLSGIMVFVYFITAASGLINLMLSVSVKSGIFVLFIITIFLLSIGILEAFSRKYK